MLFFVLRQLSFAPSPGSPDVAGDRWSTAVFDDTVAYIDTIRRPLAPCPTSAPPALRNTSPNAST
jgi:hypothetical protein